MRKQYDKQRSSVDKKRITDLFPSGRVMTLSVARFTDFGAYLTIPGEEAPSGQDAGRSPRGSAKEAQSQVTEVLLPGKYIPEGTKAGDSVRVFLYRDSEDRPVATTRMPHILLNEVKRLIVRDVTKIGAFIDWGLEKDVLLPYREQTAKVTEGQEVLCALYTDKSGRLAVTMNVYPYLKKDAPYTKDDRVDGTVYEISDNFGAFVAVDDIYSALIPKRELFGDIRVCDRISARVVSVTDDGRLTLSVREKAYLQMDIDADQLMKLITSAGGSLPFTDKASPDLIRAKTGMSKNEFKRAVGRLLKAGKITIKESSIELT